MCGIAGYIGKRKAATILLDGLQKLEYRGYDSAGMAVRRDDGAIKLSRSVGKVEMLREALKAQPIEGSMGIAHTRWATHGVPSTENTHPHMDCQGRTMVVHNGIIQNYAELKARLQQAGHIFQSQTDTEVIPHLIEDALKDGVDFPSAVRVALTQLRGTFGLVAISKHHAAFEMVAARMGSPLVIGVGKDEFFVTSDASAIVAHTRDVIQLADGEMCVMRRDGYEVTTFENVQVPKTIERVEFSEEQIQKGTYAHFMMKEIMEQPRALEDTLRGRLDIAKGIAVLGGLRDHEKVLREAKRVVMVACGTAYYAALYGKMVIEELAGIPVDVELASEFRYRATALTRDTVLFAVSQSGETADTLEAVREAKRRGVQCFGIVNRVGSAIARECGAGVYTHAGPEIGVASTKAFTAQLVTMALLGLHLGRMHGMSHSNGAQVAAALARIPELVKTYLDDTAAQKYIAELARAFRTDRDFFFIGRKYMYPVALEGALKLKELSYVHAEGCAAGELKHGSLALIDKAFPSLVLAPHDSVYEKTSSAIEQIKARGGKVIEVSERQPGTIKSDFQMLVPSSGVEMLTPMLYVIPLQLFAYHSAVERGLDPDKPRNLAKSVTVE